MNQAGMAIAPGLKRLVVASQNSTPGAWWLEADALKKTTVSFVLVAGSALGLVWLDVPVCHQHCVANHLQLQRVGKPKADHRSDELRQMSAMVLDDRGASRGDQITLAANNPAEVESEVPHWRTRERIAMAG
jgi:hypothetical protein